MAIATIVVGCDLSEGSDQALARAIGIAELHKSLVVLVHAQADDAQIDDVDNEMLKQLGEVSAAVRTEEARQLAAAEAEKARVAAMLPDVEKIHAYGARVRELLAAEALPELASPEAERALLGALSVLEDVASHLEEFSAEVANV